MERLSFLNLLEIKTGDCITVTGGGGKTGFVFQLMKELTNCGIPSMITTTTKMWYPDNFSGKIILQDQIGLKNLMPAIKSCSELQLFVAAGGLADNKVSGLTPELVDDIYENLDGRILLVEGDGAAGKPSKIYRQGEPVIPKSTNRLIFIIGCEVWNQPLGHYVHRCPPELKDLLFDALWLKEKLMNYCSLIEHYKIDSSWLIINKAEGKAFLAASEMAKIAKPFFKQIFISSIKEAWIVNVCK